MNDPKQWLENLSVNLHLLTNEKVDIRSYLVIVKEWFEKSTRWRDPVTFIRSFENPNWLRRLQLGFIVKKALNDPAIYAEFGDLVIKSIGYAISLLSDDEIRTLVNFIKGK